MGPGRLNVQGQAVDHTEVWNPGHKQAMWGEQNGVGLAYVCGQSPGQAACIKCYRQTGIYKSKQLGIIIQLSTASTTERHFLGRKGQQKEIFVMHGAQIY